jgi:hypothetical protein
MRSAYEVNGVDPLLHPEGDYDCWIEEVGEIKEAKSGRTFYLQIKVRPVHDGRIPLFECVAGYPSALLVIRAMAKHMVGMKVKVRIKHRPGMDFMFHDARILWPQD